MPLTKLPTTLQTAEVLCNYAFRFYRFPEDIISDRGPQFTSREWAAFFSICAKFPAQTIYWTHTLPMRNCIPTTWRKETQETMGSWMGPADAKEIREMKESILERTLGRGQEPWTLGVEPYPWAEGWSWRARQWRGLAGLKRPWTVAGLHTEWLKDLMASWFWIGARHSPDTGGSLPSSSVLWCLGGPRGDSSWTRSRIEISSWMILQNSHANGISKRSWRARAENCSAVSIAAGRNKHEEKLSKNTENKMGEKTALTFCLGLLLFHAMLGTKEGGDEEFFRIQYLLITFINKESNRGTPVDKESGENTGLINRECNQEEQKQV